MASISFAHHWTEIDAERIERYENMFQWNPATEHFYDRARIDAGQVLGDFGCGPGHATIEFAKRVGATGHVHAFDINAEFIARTRAKAVASGLADRITAHLLQTDRLPLADAALDRIVARNTIIYVPDPLATFREFRRVLRPGGIAHAIEGDWRMTALEPAGRTEWQDLVEAASWAWPHPEIGRSLYGIARDAGFDNVSVQVLTSPDTEGRLLGMIRQVADYARQSGNLSPAQIDGILRATERAVTEGRYLAIFPQFVVTAIA